MPKLSLCSLLFTLLVFTGYSKNQLKTKNFTLKALKLNDGSFTVAGYKKKKKVFHAPNRPHHIEQVGQHKI